MKPQIIMTNPYLLYPNARNVDLFMMNAGAGIHRTSTEFTDGIAAAGGFSTTESFPNMPHNFQQFYAYGNFEAQLVGHPIKRNPAEVKFFTNTLQYNQACWLIIDGLIRHNEESLVTARRDKGITVTTKNIDALSFPATDSVKIDGQGAATAGKHHDMQGPIGDAFYSRFLAVYGEGNRSLAIAELDAIRNPPGRLNIHGEFPMKPAAKVTAKDVASSNLILFGTPQNCPPPCPTAIAYLSTLTPKIRTAT